MLDGGHVRPVLYALLNVGSATGIVFANKAVLTTFGFHFIYALTFIHTLTTLVGMRVFCACGIFEHRKLAPLSIAPLAGAYVGYVVLNNLSLRLNTVGAPLQILVLGSSFSLPIKLCGRQVGFYQVSKIAVAPVVLTAEAIFFGKRATKKVGPAPVGQYPSPAALSSRQQSSNYPAPRMMKTTFARMCTLLATPLHPVQVVAAIAVVCLGVALSTITDSQMGSNMLGLGVGAGAIVSTAAYQIWAGSTQKELGANSFQLLHQYSPIALAFLGILVPCLEPMGLKDPNPDTLLGFPYSPASLIAIAVSALLGLAVSLSTFLVIGATSSLTYGLIPLKCIMAWCILPSWVDRWHRRQWCKAQQRCTSVMQSGCATPRWTLDIGGWAENRWTSSRYTLVTSQDATYVIVMVSLSGAVHLSQIKCGLLCCRYNVVGHVKTVIILAGGCLFFGDDMPLKKLAGINVAMFGIIWYTQV